MSILLRQKVLRKHKYCIKLKKQRSRYSTWVISAYQILQRLYLNRKYTDKNSSLGHHFGQTTHWRMAKWIETLGIIIQSTRPSRQCKYVYRQHSISKHSIIFLFLQILYYGLFILIHMTSDDYYYRYQGIYRNQEFVFTYVYNNCNIY